VGSAPKLAIVIVSWNTCRLLSDCLSSIYKTVRRYPFDVIVVDNASSDGSAEHVRREFPQVRLIETGANLGFARGNNIALSQLQSDFVLLLNPDTEVQPDAIKTLLDVMRSRPDAAIVTSRLSYGSGAFQHSAFHFPGLGQLYIDLLPAPARLYESRLNGRYPRRWYAAGQPFEIDTPLGAAMLLRREAIEQVGLFDEDFTLYCEEIDWAARFKEAGWKNLCAPAAHIVHHEGKSTSQVRVESFVKLWTSRYRLHTKHPQFAPMGLARRVVVAGMKRKMREATPEMKSACEKIIETWKR
jgi:GT2 family glycosyltransferase